MKYTLPIFLLINFWALWLGNFATGPWVMSEWYTSMNQAPWTPPGLFFGFAWTTIMICFSIYMSYAWGKIKNHKKLLTLFGIQFVLNIIWNPIFFSWHYVWFALITIASLTILIWYMLFSYKEKLKFYSLLLLPYFLWLITATSLNLYILIYN